MRRSLRSWTTWSIGSIRRSSERFYNHGNIPTVEQALCSIYLHQIRIARPRFWEVWFNLWFLFLPFCLTTTPLLRFPPSVIMEAPEPEVAYENRWNHSRKAKGALPDPGAAGRPAGGCRLRQSSSWKKKFPIVKDTTPQNYAYTTCLLFCTEIKFNIKMRFLLWLSITFEWL